MRKKYQILPLAFVAISITLVKVLYLCADNIQCTLRSFVWDITFSILEPLYLFSLISALLAVILVFVNGRVYKTWITFAKWFLLLTIVLVAFSPDTGGQYIIAFDFNRTIMAEIMGILFSGISIILVAYKSWRLRGQ